MPPPDIPPNIRSAETLKDLSRWYSKREVLYNLYIFHRRTLSNVKETMECDHGFPTALKLSDYEHVLREVFRFRKYLSADEWRQSIGPEIARRKAAGKRSKVLLNGSEVKNVGRRIRRSMQNKCSRRCARACTATIPYGVVIRTPSPQPLAPASFPSFDRNHRANSIEQHEMDLSYGEPIAEKEAESDWLSVLIGVTPLSLSGAGPGEKPLSAQLLREDCPINELLTMLNDYQCKFNHADLRLFGPNATIGILGKICFDFSNNLQEETISNSEMTSILDWIGSTADLVSLKTFFGQKALTILAAWEALFSTILHRKHLAAFNVLLSVHLSLRDRAPWTTGDPFHKFSDYLIMAPSRATTLIKAYPCDQCDLDQALRAAVFNKGPIELVQQLVDAGASLRSEDCRCSVDDLVRGFGSQECQEVELDLLKILLEAGAVVDELPSSYHGIGWRGPDYPLYVSDYLLLSGGHSAHIYDLWSLISWYSDRQQTTITVPGIFEAAQNGHEQLSSYLNARPKPYSTHDVEQVLEVALSEASGRGYTNILHSLLQFGVDPNVRMLPKSSLRDRIFQPCDQEVSSIWHPVIRAANNGRLDTLWILVGVSSIDTALLDKQVGALKLCALRNMESTQLNQILRLLSSLHLATGTRTKVLLNALQPHCCGSSHDYTDFGFVNQLLELGLAFLDNREHLHDGKTPQLLVRAIWQGCSTRALNYLVEQDGRLLSAPSTSTIEALLDAALCRPERDGILEFLSERVEGLESYLQENSTSLLQMHLWHMQCFRVCRCVAMKYRESDCENMVSVKWLLGLGATLDISGIAELTRHATESFMLAVVESVPDVTVVDKSFALEAALNFGQFHLTVALIEKGGIEINHTRLDGGQSILQRACTEDAPLWFIKFLVDKGVDVNDAPASKHGTALQIACSRGAHISCIRCLLDEGADVNAQPAPHGGFTALQCAVEYGSMNMVGLLLDYGADVNALSGRRLSGDTPFRFLRAIDVAVWFSKLDMVYFLIASGARSGRPGLTGFDGAITWATEDRHFAITALLQKHADCHHEDRMEAETRWLQAHPDIRIYKGRLIRRKLGV